MSLEAKDMPTSKQEAPDTLETAIVQKIEALAQSLPWLAEALPGVRQLQLDAFRAMLAAKTDEEVRTISDTTIRETAAALHARLVSGEEKLSVLSPTQPALIMTNHFGLYKLTPMTPPELGLAIPELPIIHPFPPFFAALYPVAEKLGSSLAYVANKLPGAIGEIQERAGELTIPTDMEKGKTRYLTGKTSEFFKEHPSTLLVTFNEGGTSGKRTGKGPLDLDPFKTGGYVVAAELGIPIILAGQRPGPQGMEVGVLEVMTPVPGDKSSFEALAQHHREIMQAWLG